MLFIGRYEGEKASCRIRCSLARRCKKRTIEKNLNSTKSAEELPNRFLKFAGISPKIRAFGLFLVVVGLLQVGSASSQSLQTTELAVDGGAFSAVTASNIPGETQLELANNPEETAGFVISEVSAVLGSDSPFIQDKARGPLTRETIITYTIKEGDTLSEIADEFGISVNTILWSNEGVSAKRLAVGTEIAILPVSGRRYVVEKGDTLGGISRQFKISQVQIKEYNNLDGDFLKIGQELILPGATGSSTRKSGSNNGSSVGGDVVANDGFYGLPVSGSYNWGQGHDSDLRYGPANDFATACGKDVYAAAAGTITGVGSGWNGGYGISVIVDHGGGRLSRYSHLLNASVNVGQQVDKGQVIGAVGTTGKSTGCHLHFNATKNPFILYW